MDSLAYMSHRMFAALRELRQQVFIKGHHSDSAFVLLTNLIARTKALEIENSELKVELAELRAANVTKDTAPSKEQTSFKF